MYSVAPSDCSFTVAERITGKQEVAELLLDCRQAPWVHGSVVLDINVGYQQVRLMQARFLHYLSLRTYDSGTAETG